MSGTAIITLVAVAVVLVVFGIPLYTVRRRNRIQSDESDAVKADVSTTLRVTPVNDAEPKLAQVPVVDTSTTIAVDPRPVPPVKLNVRVVSKDAENAAPKAQSSEKKRTGAKKAKTASETGAKAKKAKETKPAKKTAAETKPVKKTTKKSTKPAKAKTTKAK